MKVDTETVWKAAIAITRTVENPQPTDRGASRGSGSATVHRLPNFWSQQVSRE